MKIFKGSDTSKQNFLLQKFSDTVFNIESTQGKMLESVTNLEGIMTIHPGMEEMHILYCK